MYKILLVDDEPDVRDAYAATLGFLLGKNNIQLEVGENVQFLRNQLLEGNYDLTFTDNNMPDGDAIDTLEELDQHPAIRERMQGKGSKLPVLLASGLMDSIISGRAAKLENMAVTSLYKPTNLPDLRRVLHEYGFQLVR
ncbi:MAG: response regulator [Nanoarchaeota archaeon]|nr:response regulator [Nanoarchaeota archaeon]